MAAELKPDALRLAAVAAHNALKLLLEWDRKRDFIVPYKVSDPAYAALGQLRAALHPSGVESRS